MQYPRTFSLTTIALLVVLVLAAGPAAAQKPPNIVVIMADDVGIWNVSAYHRGMMGGSTPNIDRIAKEGALFTDYYAQQSCTAGRAAFILGQTPFRTGLLKVGLPAAKQGLQDKDPTIAELLKPLGYATAQIGKNHLGDRNEYLPTVHGFDEFYGILYHLNAMEEPYEADYPKDSEIPARCSARATSSTPRRPTSTTRPPIRAGAGSASRRSWTAVRCHRTRTWTRKPRSTWRMSTTSWSAARVDFMDRSVKAGKPFFLWHNTTRTHVWTHLSPKWENKSGYGLYADAMMELDWEVGSMLKKIDDLGIADNTIVRVHQRQRRRDLLLAGWRQLTRSGARRARPSKAASACPWWRGGPARSSRAPSSTRSSPAKTGCRRLLAAAGEPDVKEKL